MAPVQQTESGLTFVGDLDNAGDLLDTAAIAAGCVAYARDDDDECYAEGDDPTCFNCRARRWVPGGFTCMKGMLRG